MKQPFLIAISLFLVANCTGQSNSIRLPIFNKQGKKIGYQTEKGGKLIGPYYLNPEEYYLLGVYSIKDVAIKGNLNYKPEAVNYIPAYKLIYISASGDTLTDVFHYADFNSFFPDSSSYGKILSKEKDSIKQLPQTYPYLELYFIDPAIIPTGKWKVYHRASKKKIVDVSYDNNGNIVNCSIYQDGKLIQHYTRPPCKKRKFVKINPDGSFNTEECRIY